MRAVGDAVTAGARRSLAADERGSSAVEFALVSMPFIMLMLALPQMAMYFMTQSALDAGVIKAADSLVNSYNGSTAPVAMTPAALKSLVAGTGGLVHNDATLSVELRHLSALAATVTPVGNTVETSVPSDVMAIRASAVVTSVVPLIGTLTVQSMAIARRQGL